MTKNKYPKGTIVHGIGASQHLDSSGERVHIEGIDISSLTKDGHLNWEHKNDQPAQIVGKVIEAKKILKVSDCENQHHRKFWDKIKIPFLYIKGELLDGVGHSAAQDIAAMLRYDQTIDKRKTKQMINFSIEGGRLNTQGSNVKTCVARKITITILPCNKVCEAEMLENKDEKDDKKSKINNLLGKSEKNICEICIDEELLSKSEESQFRKKKKKNKDFFISNVRKALTAGCGLGAAPSTKINGSVLKKEHMKKALVILSNASFSRFKKKEELIQFLYNRIPNLKKQEILALAKAISYVREIKSTNQLNKLIKADIYDFRTGKKTISDEELNKPVRAPKVKQESSFGERKQHEDKIKMGRYNRAKKQLDQGPGRKELVHKQKMQGESQEKERSAKDTLHPDFFAQKDPILHTLWQAINTDNPASSQNKYYKTKKFGESLDKKIRSLSPEDSAARFYLQKLRAQNTNDLLRLGKEGKPKPIGKKYMGQFFRNLGLSNKKINNINDILFDNPHTTYQALHYFIHSGDNMGAYALMQGMRKFQERGHLLGHKPEIIKNE